MSWQVIGFGYWVIGSRSSVLTERETSLRPRLIPSSVRNALLRPIRRQLAEWLALPPRRPHIARKTLVQPRPLRLPREHFVRHVLHHARRVAHRHLAVRDHHFRRDERE